jgi:sporulation protein YlmC with PRC-barrel domain
MRFSLLSFLALLFAMKSLEAISPAVPQQSNATVPATDQSDAQVLVSANSIKGSTVLDSRGNDLGSVDRVAMSDDRQRVLLITSVGSLLNTESRPVAIPLESVQLRRGTETNDDETWLSVNVDSQSLEQLPRIETDGFLELSDANWLAKNALAYGAGADGVEVSQESGDSLVAKTFFMEDVIDSQVLGIGKTYVAIDGEQLQIQRRGEKGDEKVAFMVPLRSDSLSALQRVTPDAYPELKLQSIRRQIERQKANP